MFLRPVIVNALSYRNSRWLGLMRLIALGVFASVIARAQDALPGEGFHLIAYTPARHDRIILREVETGRTYERRFGEGWHHVWGFSPDGCRLLFTLTGANGLGRMYTARIDGTDARELVQYDELPAGQWGVWEPDWSPDGQRIAFRLARDNYNGATERQYHIAWVPAEGGAPTFYSVTGREHSPHWSPDSAWLAYLSYNPRVAGADPFSTAEPTTEPPVSPPITVNEAALWVVSADGATKYRLTNFATGSVDKPRWSHDSARIAFVYSPVPSNNTLWMIRNEPGARAFQLSYQWNLTLELTWLPDDSAVLAAARNLRGVSTNLLWRIPLDGTADDTATPFMVDERLEYADYPRWNATGDLLALRSHYEIVVVSEGAGQGNVTERAIIAVIDDAPANTAVIWSPVRYVAASCPS